MKLRYKEVTGEEYAAPGQAKKPKEEAKPKPPKEKKPEEEKKPKTNTLTPEQQAAIQAAKEAKEKEGKNKQKAGAKPVAAGPAGGTAAITAPVASSAASCEAEAARRSTYLSSARWWLAHVLAHTRARAYTDTHSHTPLDAASVHSPASPHSGSQEGHGYRAHLHHDQA